MKCVNCRNCIGFSNGYYLCIAPTGEIDTIDECIANDENIQCDTYVDNLDDDD